MAAARAGDVVAVGTGDYDEVVRLRAGVTLWGACPAATRIASSRFSDTAGSVTVVGLGAIVRNLSIGGAGPAVWVAGATSAELTDVVIRDAGWVGVVVSGPGAVVLSHSAIRRITTAAAFGGRALSLQSGARAELRRVSIEQTQEHGILASDGGTELTLEDVSILDTDSESGTRAGGRALGVQAGAHARLERVVRGRCNEYGVFVGGAGTAVELTDVVVRDVRSERTRLDGGRAVSVQEGATATLSRVHLAESREIALYAGGGGTTVSASDLVIRGVEPREFDHEGGRGAQARAGATLTLTRADVSVARDIGVYGEDDVTLLTLTDVRVHDVESDEVTGLFGRGISVQLGARVEGARLEVAHVRDIGVSASAASLAIEDLTVRDVEPRASDQDHGRGISMQGGTSAMLTRVTVDSAHEAGVLASQPGTSATIRDLAVRGTRSNVVTGFDGHGLDVQEGAQAVVERARFEGNHEASIFSFADGSTTTLSHVVVLGTLPRACAMTTCTSAGAGSGVVALGGAAISMRLFEVRDNAFCGVQIGVGVSPDGGPFPAGGTIDLAEGLVTGNVIGANLQTPGFDAARVTTGVIYRDNVRNLDAAELPVPALGIDDLGMP